MDGPLKQEIANLIKRVCETFTIQYTKAYVLALVRLIKIESRKKPEPWLLLTRPPWKEDLKSGFLIKEGGVRKNWKKRWFVVRPNYSVDYYESEAESQKPKGKKKGTMNLCGYTVVEDPNQGILVRLKRLAERMGVDFSNLPKPKEYPPLVFELNHYRRRPYYIQASNKQEFDDWVAEFRKVCWYSYGLTSDEWVHQQAFPVAVRKTRWEIGRWGWYEGYGSEEQIISEMIAEELDYDIMGRIYGKMVGPWVVRNVLRNQVQKVIDSMVMAAVKPAWAGMAKAVQELRPKIEPKIRELTEPIFKAEDQLMEAIKNAVMSVLDPILKEHVSPHISNIVAVLKSPMIEAFDECFRIFDERIEKWEPQDDLKRSFRELDWFPRSYWDMRAATDKTETMYEPLWALRLIFPDIYPWSLIWESHDKLRHHTDCAVYTWEEALQAPEYSGKHEKKIALAVKNEVVPKFKHDADIATTNYFCHIVKLIVMPPFEALVHPAAKLIIDPIADQIPEPLREFLDIKQMFEDVYHSIVDASIATVVNSDKVAPAAGSYKPVPVQDSGPPPIVVSDDDDHHHEGSPVFIRVNHSKHVLDVEGGKIQAGTRIILYPKKDADNDNQKFMFTHDGYIALAHHQDLVLDIEGGGGKGTHIIIWNKKTSDNANQLWRFKDKFIISKSNGLVLDVHGGSHEPGAELIVSDQKDSDNEHQKFNVIKH